LVRPETSVTYSGITKGVSDHHEVILEVEWEDTCSEPRVERVVPLYNKTYLMLKKPSSAINIVVSASNGRSVEEIWCDFKNIVYESIERFVPHKILRKISVPE